MLTPMQHSAQGEPSPRSASFAGLLAALASPANSATTWSDEALEDDVVTLSYERALSTHARYEPADRGDWPVSAAAGMEAQPVFAAKPVTTATSDQHAGVEARAAAQTAAERERRAASVTIRLSHAECARLRQRAAEAGLTVSAYLRSCVLEADALRAQVKQALAVMRTAGQGSKGAREQGSKQSNPRGSEGVRLTRVFGHIGKLWVGLSAGK
jgi:predicted DNA binding CopG/RHH family protein